MWTAYYQCDGEIRHTIATTKFMYTADHALDKFVARIPRPFVQLWWGWVEETAEEQDVI
jgi:hypothetical protein